MKIWFWVQLAALVVVIVIAVLLLDRNVSIGSPGDSSHWLDGIPSGVVGLFILPGFALSLLVTQIIMWSRRSPVTGTSERRLIVIELVVAAALAGFGFAPAVWELMGVIILLAAILVGVAIATTVVVTRTTARVTRGAPA